MNTPDVSYRVCAQCGAQRLTIKEGFQTKEDAQKYIDDHCDPVEFGNRWHLCIVDDKSQRQKYYEFIDSLLENARRELSSEDMVGLINDLGVVLDMHFDGIRREVEGEYAEE